MAPALPRWTPERVQAERPAVRVRVGTQIVDGTITHMSPSLVMVQTPSATVAYPWDHIVFSLASGAPLPS